MKKTVFKFNVLLLVLYLLFFPSSVSSAADSTSFVPLDVEAASSAGLFTEEVHKASTVWTVPDGVTRIRIKAYGAGGGGGSGDMGSGSSGGATSIIGPGVAITAFGGDGGQVNRGGYHYGGSAVSGTGGDYQIAGMGAIGGERTGVYSGSYSADGANGFRGGLVIQTLSVNPGDNYTINIGLGGSGGYAANVPQYGGAGENGYVVIQY